MPPPTNLPGRAPGRRRRTTRPLVQTLEPRTLFAAANVIDVAVLYTPQALAQAGSAAALNARVQRSFADTNLAFANSQVNASVRLVYEGPINYSETGFLAADLDNLQAGRGVFANVPALRARYGADLVSLWVGNDSGDEAGRAFQPDTVAQAQAAYGYNIIEEQYADDNYIFAHETGHNLGAGHDRGDPSPRGIPYAYGKVITFGNYTVGDIMSDAQRYPYYSNPNISYLGAPTGNPDNSPQPADNARAMNQIAPIVSRYEPTVVPDTAAPAAAMDSVTINAARQTLTVRVQYEDDTAVSVSGLGTGDILVAGPHGFRQFARYLGVDVWTDGPQRVATYQANIAGGILDPNVYAFVLEPNRLRDVYGNVAPSAWIGTEDSRFPNRAGPRLVTAFDTGILNGTDWRFNNTINADDPAAFYRFTLSAPVQVNAHLSGLTADLNEVLLQDANSDGQVQPGEILAYPNQPGATPEHISISLAAGTYYLWVAPPVSGTVSSYTLTLSALYASQTPTSNPTPKPPPGPIPIPPTAGTISGTVFQDNAGSGVWNRTDQGLAGWRVYLDLNGNGILDTNEPSTLSDARGDYRFTNVPAGSYSIRAVPRGGWRQSLPALGGVHEITLPAGQIVWGINFAETTTALIAGSVFDDLNGDGVWDHTDHPLAGWRVFLDTNNDGLWQPAEPSSLTDIGGNWSFSNLAPGTWRIRVVPQSGWRLTAPAGGVFQVTLPPGGATTRVFGVQSES